MYVSDASNSCIDYILIRQGEQSSAASINIKIIEHPPSRGKKCQNGNMGTFVVGTKSTSRGHIGFHIHLPSAVRASIFFARRIRPFLSLVDREVEFCELTI